MEIGPGLAADGAVERVDFGQAVLSFLLQALAFGNIAGEGNNAQRGALRVEQRDFVNVEDACGGAQRDALVGNELRHAAVQDAAVFGPEALPATGRITLDDKFGQAELEVIFAQHGLGGNTESFGEGLVDQQVAVVFVFNVNPVGRGVDNRADQAFRLAGGFELVGVLQGDG